MSMRLQHRHWTQAASSTQSECWLAWLDPGDIGRESELRVGRSGAHRSGW